ncbi:nucleotidyl transferase AbiEii/AbiGii toxin family protein [Myxococcota bacterium]|nr:nucleotidyl transferase AbiEii/AbiGii toxin family protein [Myxococcota bacterium]
MPEPTPEEVLQHVAALLRRLHQPFALVGGLAVSVRSEVRFTRDVDLAISVSSDAEVERLVFDLASSST